MNQAEKQKTNKSQIDYKHWQNLIHSTSRVEYFSSWLSIISSSIGDVENSSVLVHEEGNLLPVGHWPETHKMLTNESYLLARDAVHEGKALIEPVSDSDEHLLSYPLIVNEELTVVVVMCVKHRSQEGLASALQQLQLGSAWLELIFRREEALQDQDLVGQAVSTLSLMHSVSSKEKYHAAAMELVTVLANELHCEKVVYGIYTGKDVDLVALSNNGQFGRKMDVMNSMSDLMIEAIDQQRSIRLPNDDTVINSEAGLEDTNNVRFVKHEQFLQNANHASIMTIPFFSEEGECLSAITLERSGNESFNSEEYQLVSTVGRIAANVIDDKRQNERSIFTIVKNRFSQFWEATVTNKYPFRNVVLGIAALVVFLGLVLPGNLEIKANTSLEGYVERAVVAPFDGYIELSEKRVGDAVKKGEVLGQMDASELQLELTELFSQQSQAQSQVRESQASGDRARAKIFQTQVRQVREQINLLNLRIQRTSLIAPYDGYIVSGDISRQLGAAINRGDVMFVVAPLDKYRVVMQVDEKDIAFISEGNKARLILSALSSERLDLTVSDITPIASAEGGRNFFRVEAELTDEKQRLRPGMEGVARIEAGRYNLIWIWVRDFIDWLRIFVWKWMP